MHPLRRPGKQQVLKKKRASQHHEGQLRATLIPLESSQQYRIEGL